ncbi:MAG: serine/threonine-protein kinase [Pirellulales bacterium]
MATLVLSDESVVRATSNEEPPTSGSISKPADATWSNATPPQTPAYFRQVANLGRQIADALDYAHEQKTLHRDVKPANILIDTHGSAWLTDFGLAKSTEEENLTRTGDLIGTLQYMSPEAIHGITNRQSEVYSLGLTLYEATVLRQPYGEDSPGRLVKRICETSPPTPRSIAPHTPRDLETIILKAISREPRHRYQTAGAFAADLDNFLEGRPIHARRTYIVERFVRWCGRNRAVAALIFIAFASLCTAAIVGWQGYVSTDAALARESQRRTEAEIATERAEKNVAISLAAFEEIFGKLSEQSISSSEWYAPAIPDYGKRQTLFEPDGGRRGPGGGPPARPEISCRPCKPKPPPRPTRNFWAESLRFMNASPRRTRPNPVSKPTPHRRIDGSATFKRSFGIRKPPRKHTVTR